MPNGYLEFSVCKIDKMDDGKSIFLTSEYVKSSFIRLSIIKLLRMEYVK
jgi:hypothetical protein